MSTFRSAFPILTRRGAAFTSSAGSSNSGEGLRTRLCGVTQACLPALQAEVLERTKSACPIAEDGLRCSLQVGPDLAVPITIVGVCEDSDGEFEDSDSVVVHAPGLPGGLVVQREALLRGRAQLAAPSSSVAEAQPSLGAVCLMETVTAHFAADSLSASAGVLDTFYRRARRRHFSLVGMGELLIRGAALYPEALQLDFPYQCGGAQASKRYLDITDPVTAVFGPEMRHGAKLLTRYGVAVAVGVADRFGSLTTPAMLWHPSGAPAACLAPLLHGCAALPIGAVTLDYNGPAPGAAVTINEDPRRYMNVTIQGCYDESVWLTQGLFGVQPGSAWPPPGDDVSRSAVIPPGSCEVVGVGYNEAAAEMELFVRHVKTGEVVAAADV